MPGNEAMAVIEAVGLASCKSAVLACSLKTLSAHDLMRMDLFFTCFITSGGLRIGYDITYCPSIRSERKMLMTTPRGQ